MYINNLQNYNSNRIYAHKSNISNNFKAVISDYEGASQCERYDYEEFPDTFVEAPPFEPIFTKRMKLLSGRDGLMLYVKLGADLFSTSELLYPNLEISLRLITARPIFYLISDSPNVNLGIVDCPSYTCGIDLEDDYYKQRIDMLAYTTPVEFNFLETLAKTFIILPRKNQFV